MNSLHPNKIIISAIYIILFCFNFIICLSYNNGYIPKVQKCCRSDEVLTSDLICKRIFNDNTTNKNVEISIDKFDDDYKQNYPLWLPLNIFLSSNDSEPIKLYPKNDSDQLGIEYEAIHCDLKTEADFRLFRDDGFNDIFIYDNGSLLINENGRNRTLPSDSYCADRLLFNFSYVRVIFVCSCSYMKCIRKCCHERMILSSNTAENPEWECVTTEDDNITWKNEYWNYDEGKTDNF